MAGSESDVAAQLRAARRAWIRAKHPHAGGDPTAFAEGLRRLDGTAASTARGDARLRVQRSQRVDRVVRRAVQTWKRKRSGQPPRTLH